MTKKYEVNAMRKALVAAHKTNNRHAITSKDCDAVNISEASFENWKKWVNELRMTVTPYVQAKHDPAKDAKELDTLRGKIFPAWRKILKVGEESKLAKTMFVSVYDVDTLVVFAETYIASAKGTLWSVKSANLFRKDVEALLGCRIAWNDVLGDDDRDTIKMYEGALRTIDKNTKLLNGFTVDKVHTNGVVDEIKALSKKQSDTKKGLTKMKSLTNNAPEEVKAFFAESIEKAEADLKEMDGVMSGLTNQKKQLEKNIKKAKTIRDDNKERYNEIMKGLN